ncbi:MAG: hypothetical protein GF329_20190 [Candidatus Lokiarchaeota archaeon]|nr:hypothetical protein [Candidatus Lokiarchaeota archaeon]
MSKKKKRSDNLEKINPKLLNSYLKKARNSIRNEDYEAAVKYYQLAAKCADTAGDLQKKRIFNNRAEEIMAEQGLKKEVKKEKSFKRQKSVEKPTLKISGINIWGFILTIVIILLGLSGILFEVLFLPDVLTISEMFFYWGFGITIEIISIVMIILIYKFLITPKFKESPDKK